MKSTRLDKTIFTVQSFEAADMNNLFDRNVTIADRLRVAFHLTCRIHGIKDGESLKIDRTFFSARKF